MSGVHLIGICGTGMGSLAGLFRDAGWEVRGSDLSIYPPMSHLLAELEIPVMNGFSPAHLDWGPALVVVGNIARPDNPEAEAARRRGLRCTSMAAALEEYFLADRHVVVVAGTHGKTTTTSLLAWVLEQAGTDPGYLIGGVPLQPGARSFRRGKSDLFVIEGDEYETAFFDRAPKFLHYRPRTVILTSIELDHVEIFPDADALIRVFTRFVQLIPPDGHLLVCADDERALQVAASATARVTSYGLDPSADVVGTAVDVGPEGTLFDVGTATKRRLRSPLTGDHNLRNLIAVAACLPDLGVDDAVIERGLASFPGVARRQELRAEAGGIAVIDDFAHHPTAVRETVRGVHQRFPGRRLVAIFEPRTNSSRRGLFQEAYARAFQAADEAIIAPVDHPERAPVGDRLDPERLAADITRGGTPAVHLPSVAAIVDHVVAHSRAGDVLLVLSNGAFEGIVDRLVRAVGQPGSGRPAGATGDSARPR
ncbi:MAG: UDP-N-acetylmuramate--L-alanine ligase [Acidobacteriota bacterium]